MSLSWSREAVSSAFEIFTHLLADGIIPADNKVVLTQWDNSEVRALLHEVIETKAKVRIFEAGGSLHMIPELDNDVLGFNASLMREKLGETGHVAVFASYFIILCLLALFFEGDEPIRTRDYLGLEKLENHVTAMLTEVQSQSPEERSATDERTGLELSAIAEFWLEKEAFNPKLKNLRASTKNRVSFLLKVCRFFEDQGYLRLSENRSDALLEVMENSEIRLLPKLETVVQWYFFDANRKNTLLSLVHSAQNLAGKEA